MPIVRRRAISTIVFLSIFASAFLLLGAYQGNAQTAEELQQKINAQNDKIKQLELEIAANQRELDATSKQADSLKNSIKTLDLTKSNLLKKIEVTEDQISEKNLLIFGLAGDITEKSTTINNNELVIKKTLRNLSEEGNRNMLELLVEPDGLSKVWQTIETVKTFQQKVGDYTEKVRGDRTTLQTKKEQEQSLKADLVTLESELFDQKKIVEDNVKQKSSLLTQTKNQESNYKKIVADKIKLKDQFAQELDDYESKLKFILDPNSLPAKGVLSWPLDKILVTQFFGKTVAAQRLYSSGTHNGVDLNAAVGTPVKAMADGTVLGTGDTDLSCKGVSFGRWVFIKYNNGLSSTYGHLSLIKVNPGDVVRTGDIVGYSGNTGYSTGPHLHVSVYASAAVQVKTLPSKSCSGKVLTQPITATNGYLDPMIYLPPYTKK
jgi:murein DD-endopeptidase MepM/ murein hydrolase activator NlpD